MTNIEELRTIIANNGYGPAPYIKQMATDLLKLYEAHGEGIKGLIEGSHWIAPNEPSDGQLEKADIDNDDSGVPYCIDWYYFKKQFEKLRLSAKEPE